MTEEERMALVQDILRQKVPCMEAYHRQFPKPSCPQCARNAGIHRSALIVAEAGQGIIQSFDQAVANGRPL